jgi:hypothetical protein
MKASMMKARFSSRVKSSQVRDVSWQGKEEDRRELSGGEVEGEGKVRMRGLG